ncbi:MAG: chloride channel protein [Rhodocyclaceae bacterium]|nr:chloride channel protein [Rhodocyclaceae bacterium]
MSQEHIHLRRDFTADRRLLALCGIALGIGVLSTGGAWVLLTLIRFFTNLFFFQTLSMEARSPAEHTLGVLVIAVPVIGGLLVGLIARFGSEKIRGHGIPEAIEAILYRKSLLSPKVAVLKPLASGIAIGSGGPFGAEGPIIMIGGALGSMIAQAFSLTAGERKTLLVAGATAGMTAVFGTPLAAVLLAVELLLFEWRPRSLLPVIAACTVAGFVRPFLIDSGAMFPLQTGVASLSALLMCIFCGLLAGAAAALMSASLYRIEDVFAKLPVHWMWWPAIGGLAVGIGGYFQPHALGVGYDVIDSLLHNRMALGVVLSIVAIKAIIWVLALASGTSGGVLAPLLMMGAGIGAAVAQLFPGADAALWPLVCMAAMLAGALGVPLTATVFAVGLTGDFNALLPLLLACGTAHALTVLLMRRSIMTERIARRGLHVHREYSVDPHEHATVAEVMSDAPICVDASLTLAQAAEHHFGIAQPHRRYPIVSGNRLVGMLDHRLLHKAMQEYGADYPLAALFSDTAPVFALPGETCQAIARRMAAQTLKCLPVVADETSLAVVGFISSSDLVKLARSGFHEEHVRERIWAPQRSGLTPPTQV